jgi:hypothetical protein
MADIMPDPCSLANVTQLRTTALDINLELDFEAKTLAGSVTITLVRRPPHSALPRLR